MQDRPFDFLPLNARPEKPRDRGITEIRGPGYEMMGPRQLEDLLTTMGRYIDILKFSYGTFTLFDRDVLEEFIDLCHEHDVLVSTGGFVEYVLVRAPNEMDEFLSEAAEIGFDVVEVSRGYISADRQDLLELTELVQEYDMKAKPEIDVTSRAGSVQSDAVGDEVIDTGLLIDEARDYLDAGAYKLMIEEEGITEGTFNDELMDEWRTDIVYDLVSELGLEACEFEASDPAAFEWYIKNFGPNVNLFVDSSQIVQLEAMRSGISGKPSTWGRIVTHQGNS